VSRLPKGATACLTAVSGQSDSAWEPNAEGASGFGGSRAPLVVSLPVAVAVEMTQRPRIESSMSLERSFMLLFIASAPKTGRFSARENQEARGQPARFAWGGFSCGAQPAKARDHEAVPLIIPEVLMDLPSGPDEPDRKAIGEGCYGWSVRSQRPIDDGAPAGSAGDITASVLDSSQSATGFQDTGPPRILRTASNVGPTHWGKEVVRGTGRTR